MTVLPGAEQKASRELAGVWKSRGKVRGEKRAVPAPPSPCTALASVPPTFLPGDCELTEVPVTPHALGRLQLPSQRPPPLEASKGQGSMPNPQPSGRTMLTYWPRLMLMPSRDYKATRSLRHGLIHTGPLLHMWK